MQGIIKPIEGDKVTTVNTADLALRCGQALVFLEKEGGILTFKKTA